MRDLIERKEVKECIEALKQRFMREAVSLDASDEGRKEAALKYHLLDRLVSDVANYNPEEKQNG